MLEWEDLTKEEQGLAEKTFIKMIAKRNGCEESAVDEGRVIYCLFERNPDGSLKVVEQKLLEE